ncbi:MAG: hypothetical protein KC449_28810, partial [Anaerolineales bacterium]|nr:hypothetical protein [Anaerolineales bacterium]
ELYTILNRGMIEKKQQTVTGRFPIEAIKIMFELQKKSQPIDIRMQGDESYVELLNIKFSTGKMVRHILDAKIDNKFFNLQKENFHSEEEKYLELKLIDATVVEIFPDKFIRESERLGRVLVERFNANSVFLFGSLVWGKIHNPQTDIDLAVSGLNSGEMYKAIGYLEQITQFPFNLVDINTVPESLRERILTEGKLLYERELVAVG